ncbi:MAG: hypothetical protein KJ017_09630 [Alphaproteobacteria bacterium]|nr:hypothetical protein [Alphaproteobacteria bacterium]
MEIIEPKNFLNAFNHVSQAMTLNASVKSLEGDDDTVLEIHRLLRDMGQTKFVQMTRKSADAMVSVPLYAGNGIVVKIIPQNYADRSTCSLFKLPPISVDTVEGKHCDFQIKTYPWLSPRGVTQASINEMRSLLSGVGLTFNENEDTPTNIHRLPDKSGTLISVDEDIYHGRLTIPQLSEAWVDYVRSIFPIYEEGRIPPQTKDTDFSFVSIHNPAARSLEFTTWWAPCVEHKALEF